MAEKIKYIGLTKLFLWIDSEKLETYPEALSRLNKDKLYTKPEIASEIFQLIDKGKNNFIRADKLRNCFGLEKISDNKLVINGINFFKKLDSINYQPTNEALSIGENYKNSSDEDDWLIPLVCHLARYEVRTRLMLYLLGKCDWCLTFKNSDFFSYPSTIAKLINNENNIELFSNNAKAFNKLLNEYKQISLGRYWEKEITDSGYELSSNFKFTGKKEENPSTNDLNTSLKCSLNLFKYLGILESKRDGWMVNSEKAIEIMGQELARDFINIELEVQKVSSIDNLKKIIDEIKDNQGFVVTSQLARQWATKTGKRNDYEKSFDLFIREQEYHGKLKIVEKNQGQPRHGRGLFGDNNARKIRINF